MSGKNNMEVLGKDISEQCASIYSRIANELKCRILFVASKNRKNYSQEIGNDLYKIELDISLPNNYFEELLLHECIHILQTRLGYKDMNVNYNRKLSIYINDVIMDIDVNRRLKNDYNYMRDNDYAQSILISKVTKEIEHISNSHAKVADDDKKILGLSLAFLDLCYTNKYKTLMNLVIANVCPQILIYQNKFVEIVQSHPETNYRTVHQIQKLSIDLFGL